MIPLPFIIIFLVVALIPNPPLMTSPVELAKWAECKPPKICYGISQSIDYKITKGWESASVCLSRGNGDCKCMATTASETIGFCEGYTHRIVTLKSKGFPSKYHAITVYTDKEGRRGFINSSQCAEFPPDTDWNEIIAEVLGGPWEVYNK
jgi:hypothetical protein